MRPYKILACLFLLTQTSVNAAPINKILFGSCSHQDKQMPIFDAINQESADLFIFLGDNIYGDTEDMSKLKAKYQRLGGQPGFQQLKKNTPLIAIWDDHDYGENDAGEEYPQKEASRKIMLDFWQEPTDSPRRTQKGGIYTSYIYGEANQTVQIIMPDLRWNRPPLNPMHDFSYAIQTLYSNKGPYKPVDSENQSMLGEEQWQWLEKELLKPSRIKIIASSLQLLPDFTGWESWANFPADRKRLFDFIKKHKINGLVMISGDTHWGELSKYQPENNYPLWEITSSGLTQEWKKVSPNKHRVGKPTSNVNYGFIEIDWQNNDTTLNVGLKDIAGNIVQQQQLTLSELDFRHNSLK